MAETSIHSARRGNQGARAGSADAVGGQEAATAVSARTAVTTAKLRTAVACRRVTGDRMGRAEAGERYRFGPLRRRSRPMNRLCSLLKYSSTIPVGPLRCLETIISAMFFFSVFSL